VQLAICNRLYWQEQPRQLGRPATKRSLWRPVRRPRASRQIRLFENGHHPETIVELSREIELDMGGKPSSANTLAAGARRVA
jgi:hypothetical protein